MSVTVKVSIIDKNGKHTTVTKKVDYDVVKRNNERIAKLVEAGDGSVPKTCLIEPTKNAVNFGKDESGYDFYFTHNSQSRLYDHHGDFVWESTSTDIDGVRKDINTRLAEITEVEASNRPSAEQRLFLETERGHLAALGAQLSSKSGLAQLNESTKSYNAFYKSLYKLEDKTPLRYSWDLTQHDVEAIKDYGRYVEKTYPDLSGYERDTKITELLLENEPFLAAMDDAEESGDTIHDIGEIYVLIRKAFGTGR